MRRCCSWMPCIPRMGRARRDAGRAKDEHLAIEQTTGRQRLNIHGAIDLETGRTKMIEAEAIDAASTIKLLAGIEALYSTTALIHVFLDNARYHHAKIVRKWLSQPGRRIALHFVPSYCPHLNPIERLWALMHQHLTHNKTYPTCREFADAILNFLRDEVGFGLDERRRPASGRPGRDLAVLAGAPFGPRAVVQALDLAAGLLDRQRQD